MPDCCNRITLRLTQESAASINTWAIVLSTRAGYDPFSFVEVLQNNGHIANDDNSVAMLFKTHPHPDVRLEKLSMAMASDFDSVKGLTLDNRFYRIKP